MSVTEQIINLNKQIDKYKQRATNLKSEITKLETKYKTLPESKKYDTARQILLKKKVIKQNENNIKSLKNTVNLLRRTKILANTYKEAQEVKAQKKASLEKEYFSVFNEEITLQKANRVWVKNLNINRKINYLDN